MKKIVFIFIVLVGNVYLSEADGWIHKNDVAGTTSGNAVSFSINGKGYIATGSSIISAGKSLWEYDPTTDVWTEKADLPGEGRESASGFSIGGKGYVGLGLIGDSKPTDDFWEYDPITNTWMQKASFLGGIRSYAFSFAIGDKGYVGAGTGKGAFKQDFYEYDPSTDQWTQKSNYAGGKVISAIAFTINNKGYVGTGRDNNLNYRNDFWEYNPTNDSWTKKADFAGTARASAVGFSINDKGYVGLGITIDTFVISLHDFWQYDLSTDSWHQKSDFPGSAGDGAASFSIAGKAYVGLGGDALERDWWEYIADCEAPTGLTANNVTNSKVTLNWNAVSDAVKYKVRYRVSGTNPWTNVGSTTTTRKINGLSANTTYQWQVRTVCSIDPSVSSDWSVKESFATELRLSEDEETNNIEVYPNPAKDFITFSLPSNQNEILYLFNLLGEKVKEENVTGTQVTMDVSSLPQGLYLVRTESKVVGRFVKE